MTVRSIAVTGRPDAAPALAAPKSLIVAVDRKTDIVVALFTDSEKDAGLIPGHWFAECDMREGIPLSAFVQIGAPYDL